MDTVVNEKRDNGEENKDNEIDFYRESIKKALYSAVGNALDEETQRATKEMIEGRDKAIKQLADEEIAVINKIIEEEKKAIWVKAEEARQSESFSVEAIKKVIAQAYLFPKSIQNEDSDIQLHDTNHDDAIYGERVDLEILPPRDQSEIAAINTYLINMHEVAKVELVTMVDKSIFKLKLSTPVDFIEKLGSLPQILTAEEVIENKQKKIKIELRTKTKQEQSHNELNGRVNQVFDGKK